MKVKGHRNRCAACAEAMKAQESNDALLNAIAALVGITHPQEVRHIKVERAAPEKYWTVEVGLMVPGSRTNLDTEGE